MFALARKSSHRSPFPDALPMDQAHVKPMTGNHTCKNSAPPVLIEEKEGKIIMAAFSRAFTYDPFATNVLLVVEDDRDIATMLKGVLEDCGGYLVILATNASQAFDIVSEVRPDLFLLDYRLPDLDGLELYHRLHAHRQLATIPVLFLTAHAPKDLLENEHLCSLSKPFEVDDLQHTIEGLLTG